MVLHTKLDDNNDNNTVCTEHSRLQLTTFTVLCMLFDCDDRKQIIAKGFVCSLMCMTT